ncbi:hypothetical protein WDU94_010024 [Cyamophila willieti]
MKENFFIIIESYHIQDNGQQENVHELTGDKLKQREVVHIDIGNDPVSAGDYKETEDPTKFKSEKTGRGPLQGNWIEKFTAEGPIMTAYKLVQGLFQWRGLQTRIEDFMMATQQRLYTKFNRFVPTDNAICSLSCLGSSMISLSGQSCDTCYKLVTAEFKWFGFQGRVENFIHKAERRLFTNFHRQVFCWIDRWHDLTMEDIRRIEEETKKELDRQRLEGEVRGMKAE